MDRRQFMQTMAALTAAAVIPTVAEAAVTTVAVDPNAKYKEAMRLFDRCVPYSQDTDEVTVRFNQMLTYLRDNFAAPEVNDENIEATKLLLRGRYSIAELRSIPPVVADAIYPITLVKLGLHLYDMKPNPHNMDEWNWFHDTYVKLIVGSC